jgi:hypothetical protein
MKLGHVPIRHLPRLTSTFATLASVTGFFLSIFNLLPGMLSDIALVAAEAMFQLVRKRGHSTAGR